MSLVSIFSFWGETMGIKIDWSSRSKLRGPGENSIGDLVRKLSEKLAPQASGVSISYLDDRGMRKLNRLHRGINKTTDVLSFPSSPEKGEVNHIGDIVISLEKKEKKAKHFGISRRRQVETLVIHGFLHLCGHDHEKDAGEMMGIQASLEKELLADEPLPMTKKRGRKPGSRLKTLKTGARVVVTGRAAQALVRREKLQKEKMAKKAALKAKTKALKTARAEKAARTEKAKDKKPAGTSGTKTRRAASLPKGGAKAAAAKTTRAATKAAKLTKPAKGKGPGRPRKEAKAGGAAKTVAKRQPARKRQTRLRSGVIS
jgi:probable rRNA maturation factor